MFADYRVPQILNTLGCLWYSPLLENAIRNKKEIESGCSWEIQLRGMSLFSPASALSSLLAGIEGNKTSNKNNTDPERTGCSIWCVELIRREIMRKHPDAKVNAILIDFFLYDTMKEREAKGQDLIPHHRTRSIWY